MVSTERGGRGCLGSGRAPGPLGLGPAPAGEGPWTLSGDFTMLKYIARRSTQELEWRLGLHAGRLDAGACLIVMVPWEIMGADDFLLNASTRWSGGLMAEGAGEDRRLEGLLSERLGEPAPQALRRKVADFFTQNLMNTPAKVIAAQAHQPWMSYPDALVLGPGQRSGVPQFSLRPGIAKRALLFARLAPAWGGC